MWNRFFFAITLYDFNQTLVSLQSAKPFTLRVLHKDAQSPDYKFAGFHASTGINDKKRLFFFFGAQKIDMISGQNFLNAKKSVVIPLGFQEILSRKCYMWLLYYAAKWQQSSLQMIQKMGYCVTLCLRLVISGPKSAP